MYQIRLSDKYVPVPESRGTRISKDPFSCDDWPSWQFVDVLLRVDIQS